jgi:UDP-N-acetyl-D-mannosaminuronic acid dehydrogenase
MGSKMTDVCVLGLGYVGLPTAALLAVNGLNVVGVDTNEAVVREISSGELSGHEAGLRTLVQAAVGSGRLAATTTPRAAETFIIAVPTPLGPDNRADLTHVRAAVEALISVLKPGALVVLESTVPPGTTEGVLCAMLTKHGLQPGKDIHVAYCPERVLPGRILAELTENDRVIGGIDAASGQRAAQLYARFVQGEMVTTSASVAELVKLAENSYRDVNIAFANELLTVCQRLGVDGLEVIRLANRHPRVNILQPGPGVGGHCIPVDPWFIVEAAPAEAQLIATARRVNKSMPAFVVQALVRLLQGIRNPKVSIWGVAYKADVDDARESPALDILALLKKAGIRFAVTDPLVKRFPYPIKSLQASVKGADCILILTDHRDFRLVDPETVGGVMRTRMVLDARSSLDRSRWSSAGFTAHTLGSLAAAQAVRLPASEDGGAS